MSNDINKNKFGFEYSSEIKSELNDNAKQIKNMKGKGNILNQQVGDNNYYRQTSEDKYSDLLDKYFDLRDKNIVLKEKILFLDNKKYQ